jgi:hypothetical protein
MEKTKLDFGQNVGGALRAAMPCWDTGVTKNRRDGARLPH